MRGIFAAAAIALSISFVALQAMPAAADTKSEMIVIMDKLADNKPGNEALVDWDNLVVNTPQTKNMDIKAMYHGMDAANKKAFRASFLARSRSHSRRARAGTSSRMQQR